MALSPEIESRFEDFDRMFMTPGWKELHGDVIDKMESLKERTLRCMDIHTLGFLQGQYVGLEYVAKLPDLVEQLRKQANNEQIDLF